MSDTKKHCDKCGQFISEAEHDCYKGVKGLRKRFPDVIEKRREQAKRIVDKVYSKGYSMSKIFDLCHFSSSNLFHFKNGLAHEQRYNEMEACIDSLESTGNPKVLSRK